MALLRHTGPVGRSARPSDGENSRPPFTGYAPADGGAGAAARQRAEREFRRKLDELRATGAQRYAERDRSVAELKRKAEPKERRTLVATAYWRCI